MPQSKQDRVFVRKGRRAYRRSYSMTEFRIGIVCLLLLGAIAAWVAWKGRHPDPELFDIDVSLLEEAPSLTDRGIVPEALADEGWQEKSLSSFDASTLYEKINGREDYYKSYGFQRLYFVSLENNESMDITIDIELFDLATAANALGAYSGERSEKARPTADAYGLSHHDRNALFLTRGRYYIRAIGSEESDTIRLQLQRLEKLLKDQIQGEELPWGYAIFVGEMGFAPGEVSYVAENAYSLAFARQVYSASRPDDDLEWFLMANASEEAAASLVQEFRQGFAQYGEMRQNGWVQDRYLATYAKTQASGRWLYGVHGAQNPEAGEAALAELTLKLVDREPPAVDSDMPLAREPMEETPVIEEY